MVTIGKCNYTKENRINPRHSKKAELFSQDHEFPLLAQYNSADPHRNPKPQRPKKVYKLQPKTKKKKKKVNSQVMGLSSKNTNFSKLIEDYDRRNHKEPLNKTNKLSRSAKLEFKPDQKTKAKPRRKKRNRMKSLREPTSERKGKQRVNSVNKYDSVNGAIPRRRKSPKSKKGLKEQDIMRPKVDMRKRRDRGEANEGARSASRNSSRSNSVSFKNKEILRKRLKERALINQNKCKLNLKDMIVHDRLLASIVGTPLIYFNTYIFIFADFQF